MFYESKDFVNISVSRPGLLGVCDFERLCA